MRVSLINFNLVAKDAIGVCIIAQARYFRRRGDVVQIFTEQPPEGAPADIAPLCRTVSLAQLRQDRDGLLASTDVCIYHYGARHSLMETITKIDGGQVIFYFHNVTPPELWQGEEDRAILQRGVDGVRLAAHADLVIADSNFNLAEVVAKTKLPSDRLIALPLPVDTDAFHPGPRPEELRRRHRLGDGPLLLYVGRMAHNKRIDLLVDLLAAVRRHREYPQPQAQLLLVGDHESAPAYRSEAALARQHARSLGVADGVVFAGRVDDLPDYYRLASVYVTTSQHEGFCVPLVEAMASGTPIVAAASTAIPETLGDAGLLAPVDEKGVVDVVKMADAVARVLSTPVLAADLRHRGLARARQFSHERYAEQLDEIIAAHCANLPLRLQPAPYIQMAEAEATAQLVGDGESASESTTSTAGIAVGLVDDPAYGGVLHWPELAAEAEIAMPDYMVRSKLPVIGRLVAWVRRNLTSHLKEPYLDPIIQRQQAFNLRSTWTTNELTRRVTRLDRQNRDLSVLLERIAAAREQPQMQSQVDELTSEQELMRAMLLRAESQIARLESQWSVAGSHPEARQAAESPALASLDAAAQGMYGLNYLRCSEAVGGDLETAAALYEPFVPLFRDHLGPVLDLGCGRGVFLELMRHHGIRACGADVDGNMVAHCLDQGLDVEQADVFDHLHGQTDGSLGGVFCAHVVEHLPRTRLMEFADLCWRKLEPGGVVVWITPHGGSLAPLHATFYKDLTHTRPLHPDLLAFILESNGFLRVETRTFSDMPPELKLQLLPDDGRDETIRIANTNIDRLNSLVFGNVDCAALGWR